MIWIGKRPPLFSRCRWFHRWEWIVAPDEDWGSDAVLKSKTTIVYCMKCETRWEEGVWG